MHFTVRYTLMYILKLILENNFMVFLTIKLQGKMQRISSILWEEIIILLQVF